LSENKTEYDTISVKAKDALLAPGNAALILTDYHATSPHDRVHGPAGAHQLEKTDNHSIQADVSTPEGTSKVINEILNRFNGTDIIIHPHGLTNESTNT